MAKMKKKKKQQRLEKEFDKAHKKHHQHHQKANWQKLFIDSVKTSMKPPFTIKKMISLWEVDVTIVFKLMIESSPIRDGHVEVCKNKQGFPAALPGNPGVLIGHCRISVRHSLSDVALEFPFGSWMKFTLEPKSFCRNPTFVSDSWIKNQLFFALHDTS